MRIIPPLSITPAMITACNVPETDYSAWSSGTAYVTGNRVLYGHKNYEALQNSTNKQPDLYTTGVTPYWLDLGYDNRWKMFDQVVGTRTSQASPITITLTPGQVIDSIAFLDVVATSISVTMTDPIEGVVYSDTLDMVMGSGVVDAYTYFFTPIILDDAAVLLGLPAYVNASIAITISNNSGNAEIGTLVLGIQKDIGGTKFSPSIGITDYSKKTTDDFGNITVVQRAFTKRMKCELHLTNDMIDDLQRTLAAYRTTPIVWVGADDLFSAMIIYGYYKSFEIVVPYANNSHCTLDVEGLA